MSWGKWGKWIPEYHKVHVDIHKEIDIDWNLDVRQNIDLDVDKDIYVKFDTDLKLEGNSAVAKFDIEGLDDENLKNYWTKDGDGHPVYNEAVQIDATVVAGTVSLASLTVNTDDWRIDGSASAGPPDTDWAKHKQFETFAEVEILSVDTEHKGVHTFGIAEAAIEVWGT